jgi:hypothetical protein
MSMIRKPTRGLVIATVLVAGGLSVSGCATKKFVREQIATVNTRIDAVDARAQDGIRRADAANAAAQQAAQAAQAAASAAQAAAADARTAGGRIDQLTTRVDTMEQQAAASRAARN